MAYHTTSLKVLRLIFRYLAALQWIFSNFVQL